MVGEEGSAADPGLLGRLAAADLAFVVDPVDGTANFAAGLPLFGCMVAAILRGEVVAGWIHDPLGDDTAVALRGEGAWIEAPGGHQTPLQVAAPAPLRASAPVAVPPLDAVGPRGRLAAAPRGRRARRRFRRPALLAAAARRRADLRARRSVLERSTGQAARPLKLPRHG